MFPFDINLIIIRLIPADFEFTENGWAGRFGGLFYLVGWLFFWGLGFCLFCLLLIEAQSILKHFFPLRSWQFSNRQPNGT